MTIWKWSFVIAVGLFLFSLGHYVPVGAQESGEVPKIILSGLEAYKAEGAEAAIKAWIKDSSIEGSKDALSQANVLRTVQDYYGAYKTFDVIRTRNLSPTTRVIYMILDYEKGPLFSKFVVYRAEKGWVLTMFTFNTKEELIVPACP